MERDVSISATTSPRLYFNSHAHVERDVFILTSYTNCIDFNSHAHVERDADFEEFPLGTYISTHTLTWSVTDSKENQIEFTSFQLTRSRGA